MKTLLILLAFLCLINNDVSSQSGKASSETLTGLYLEYSTTVILSHNIKLSTGIDYFKSKYYTVAFQSGAEFIWGFQGVDKPVYAGTPYYDLNALVDVHLLPNSDISLEPFCGPVFRFAPNENNNTYFDLKYGMVLYFNASNSFNVLIKVMNLTSRATDNIPIIMGIGFRAKLF